MSINVTQSQLFTNSDLEKSYNPEWTHPAASVGYNDEKKERKTVFVLHINITNASFCFQTNYSNSEAVRYH